jgi:Ni/Co efflux regulator RcnB
MKPITIAAAAVLALTSLSGAALADPYHDHDHHGGPPPQAMQHHWRKGDRIDHAQWGRYERVDWRRHHLRAPPRGYEWRQVDGNFVLAAAATGLVASIIAAGN